MTSGFGNDATEETMISLDDHWGYIDLAREPAIFICDVCGNEQAISKEIWEDLPLEVRNQILELVKGIELENMLIGNGKSDEIEPPIH